MDLEQVFLDFSVRKLRQLNERIHDCVNRLGEDEVWARGHAAENSIGNLMLHLSGNVRQWIVSAIGGLVDTRDRESEFAATGGISRQELLDRLGHTIEEAAAALEKLPPARLRETVAPQGYEVTVLEAVYHVVEHFAQHTGQIIFATKMLTGADLGFYRHLRRPAPHGEKTP